MLCILEYIYCTIFLNMNTVKHEPDDVPMVDEQQSPICPHGIASSSETPCQQCLLKHHSTDCKYDAAHKIIQCHCSSYATRLLTPKEVLKIVMDYASGRSSVQPSTEEKLAIRVNELERDVLISILVLEQLRSCVMKYEHLSKKNMNQVREIILTMKQHMSLPSKYDPELVLSRLADMTE